MRRGVRWAIVGLSLLAGCPAWSAAKTAMEDLEDLFPDLKPVFTKKTEAPRKPSPRKSHAKPLRLSGSFREKVACRLSEPQQLTQFRSIAQAAGTGALSDEVSYKVSGWLWYDAVYDLTNHYPQSVADDQRLDAQLRDTYVDISKERWDFRVGKQQIVWGEAIGAFFADVVNAKDYREFILQDFDLIRIPEWGVNVEYTREAFHAEALWLPWPEMDKVGRPGSEYYFTAFLPAVPLTYGPEQKPSKTLENGEVGGRLSYRLKGWDGSAFYLRTWDKTPVYAASYDVNGLVLSATHPRLTINGLTLSKELDGTVYKGEAVYYVGKHFPSSDPAAPSGLLRKDLIEYYLGADHTFEPKLHASFQLGQRVIRQYEASLVGQRAWNTYISVSLRHPLWEDRLEPGMLLTHDLNTTDMMFSPNVSYKFGGRWKVGLGMDLFAGPADGLYGQFSKRDRVWSDVRVDF